MACAVGTHIYFLRGDGDDGDPTTETYRYDSEADEWTTLEPMPEPRWGHALVVLGGLIYILGGSRQFRSDGLSSIVRFDPASGRGAV